MGRTEHDVEFSEAVNAIGERYNWDLAAFFADVQRDIKEPKRKKAIYIGAPACFKLELACREIVEAFGDSGGCYVVGSALERSDWRDIDIRLLMSDEEFGKLFPNAYAKGTCCHWEHDARWILLTAAMSERLSKLTGLPVDFQFQPINHANEHHKGMRSAIGFRVAVAELPESARRG